MTEKSLVNFTFNKEGKGKIFNMPPISILMSLRANVKSHAGKILKEKYQ